MRWRGLLVMLLVGVGFAQIRSSPSQVSPKQPQAPTRYDKYAPSSQPANDEHSTTSDERTNPSPTGNEFTHTEEPEPDPTAFVLIEKEPVATNLEEIKRRIGYPPLAKEAGIQGKVIARVLVGKTGKYERHIILKSPHKLLTEAVEKELPNLEFTPGIQAGKPIRVWVTLTFDFQSSDKR